MNDQNDNLSKLRHDNISRLRQMLNTEVNIAMFNPDVRDHTPESIIIVIRSTDGHTHCITPDGEIADDMFNAINCKR